jgi:hypothetical protein
VPIGRPRLAMLLAACVIAACGPAAARPSATVSATATPAADAVARCARLATRDIAPCPPASLPAERIAIVNGTHGAVSDSDARVEGEAYLRVHALYVWAVHQPDGDAFLLSGAIVPPELGRTNIFRDEAAIFADARAAGGRARIDPLTTTRITLVPVPQALRDLAARDGMVTSAYAWVDNQSGPAHAWIETPGGGSRDVLRIAVGQPHPILVFGQVRDDADLGSIWYQGGDLGCLADPKVRVVCGI